MTPSMIDRNSAIADLGKECFSVDLAMLINDLHLVATAMVSHEVC